MNDEYFEGYEHDEDDNAAEIGRAIERLETPALSREEALERASVHVQRIIEEKSLKGGFRGDVVIEKRLEMELAVARFLLGESA
jgi:hypothetical protein